MGAAPSHDLSRTVSLAGKTVVVTGSNTGIGKEAARELARAGARVILACRNQTKGNLAKEDIIADTKNENVVVKDLDLASLQSVRDFARDFNANEDRLDILVNNAGVAVNERTLTKDGYEIMFGTNHLGHFLLTTLLLDKIKASAPSRIVSVASLAHEKNPVVLDDLQSERNFSAYDFSTYGRSKSANVLFTVQLAKILEGSGVTAHSLHPGFVHTDIGRNAGCFDNRCTWCCLDCCWRCTKCQKMRNANEGAQTTVYCCLEPSIARASGRYYSDCKETPAKPHATDPVTAQKLWDISVDLVGLKHDTPAPEQQPIQSL